MLYPFYSVYFDTTKKIKGGFYEIKKNLYA